MNLKRTVHSELNNKIWEEVTLRETEYEVMGV